MSDKSLKIAGYILAAAGFLIGALSDKVGEAQTERYIDEAVEAKMKEMNNRNED